jgi:hypothetical protein
VAEELEEPGVVEPAGVISTDQFMSDFDLGPSEVGLQTGLGDELTALTGGGTERSRPSATVNKLPQAGEDKVVLHRDEMVDKGIVQKIIEGIEKL